MKVLCFDIGGSAIKYALVENGVPLWKKKMPTPLEQCSVSIPRALVQAALPCEAAECISVSSAGQIDNAGGSVRYAIDTLPGYTGTPLAEIVARETGKRCYVENDINCAAIGEHKGGAAKGVDTFLCIAVGTGVGGALMIDGKVYRGVKGSAGELGHMVVEKDGLPCLCGMRGCFEQYASAPALQRIYREVTGDSLSGLEITEKILAGDERAKTACDRYAEGFAGGLASLVHILDMGLVVIGGGIFTEPSPFIPVINERLAGKIMPSFAGHTRVVGAALGNDAQLLGAYWLAADNQ